MTRPQGDDPSARPPLAARTVDRMCAMAGVSRASCYRDWASTSPGAEETALRDRMQHLALGHRFYGYRRITALLRREGWPRNPPVPRWRRRPLKSSPSPLRSPDSSSR